MKKAQMKEFLREMGRMQEEDYVTTEELYKIFNTVLEAVKRSQLDNTGKIKELDTFVEKKSKELETYFGTMLEAVDDRMKQVKDGAAGKDGSTPVAGVDYPDYQEIRDFITEAIDKLPRPDDATQQITVDYIKDQLMALEGNDRLPHTAINGIEEFIDEKVRLMEANLRRGPMAITGGGTGASTGGSTTLSGLTDVTLSSPASGELLQYNGSAWVNATVAGSGDVTAAAAFGTDNVIVKSDGTAKGVQATGISVADTTNNVTGLGTLSSAGGTFTIDETKALSDKQNVLTEGAFVDGDKTKLDGIETGADVTDTANVTAAGALMDSEVDADIKTLSLPANTTISAFGATLVDDADAATARTTLDVDQAGTDNSTDVTLVTTSHDYLSIAGQAITLGQIDISDDTNLTAGAGCTLSGDTLNVDVATTSVSGSTIHATAAEVDTGTATNRSITPDALQGSKRNIRWLVFNLVEATTDCATGTNLGGDFVSPIAGVIQQSDTTPFYLYATNSTAGTTGTMTVDININGTSIMTTNKLDFDTTEKTTTTATTPPDLTTTALAVGDIITIDVDAVHTTAAKGLTVYMAVLEA